MIDKNASFTLDCDEAGVCTLRALILASGNPDPIPDGSVLYSCEISIDLNAILGTYPLVCTTSMANEAPPIACVDGSVEVIGATPPPINTGIRDREENGCQVTDRTGRRDAWLVALPASLLWLRRRRLSRKAGTRSFPKASAG